MPTIDLTDSIDWLYWEIAIQAVQAVRHQFAFSNPF